MAKWMKPEEEYPNCYVGDRIIIIVAEREGKHQRLKPRLVILECSENGWTSKDDTYCGYTPEDGLLWSYEDDATQIVRTIFPETEFTNREQRPTHSDMD